MSGQTAEALSRQRAILERVASDTATGATRRRWQLVAVRALADAISGLIILGAWGVAFTSDFAGLTTLIPASALLIGILAASGLYAGHGPSAIERLRMRAIAVGIFSLVVLATGAASSDTLIIAAPALVIALLAAGYYAELASNAVLARYGLSPANALIIGDGARVEALIHELQRRAVFGLKPVAVFSPVISGGERVSSGSIAGIPVVASIDAIQAPIDIAIAVERPSLAAIDKLRGGKRDGLLSLLYFVENPTGETLWPSTRSLGVGIGVKAASVNASRSNRGLKRAADIAIAGIAAVPAAVLTALAALAVKAVDRGPIFYAQRRIGEGGRIIEVLKVRTMYHDGDQRLREHFDANPRAKEEWEQRFKLDDDPRVIPVIGTLLRKSSIDELPQIWNVLRGDMSIVGPRPFPEYHLERFDEQFRAVRCSVAPGLTGFWQVSTRSEGDLEAQRSDDLFYIRNRSFWLDLYIILQTVPAVISGTGAR